MQIPWSLSWLRIHHTFPACSEGSAQPHVRLPHCARPPIPIWLTRNLNIWTDSYLEQDGGMKNKMLMLSPLLVSETWYQIVSLDISLKWEGEHVCKVIGALHSEESYQGYAYRHGDHGVAVTPKGALTPSRVPEPGSSTARGLDERLT